MNVITTKPDTATDYLVASDFDQTLSFNDSGYALAEMLGISDFEEKVKGLSHSNLVQPGAELTYLLRHDPAFRSVLEDVLKWDSNQIRELITSYGLAIQDWDKIRTDWITFHNG